ncbi:MAG TPA: hypothetical protein VFA20_02880 [Myxococcaceae bacterium]|nr:hypothetical protein [Myxococcaceae bacterium]
MANGFALALALSCSRVVVGLITPEHFEFVETVHLDDDGEPGGCQEFRPAMEAELDAVISGVRVTKCKTAGIPTVPFDSSPLH